MKPILLFGLPSGMELLVMLFVVVIIVVVVVFIGKAIYKMMK